MNKFMMILLMKKKYKRNHLHHHQEQDRSGGMALTKPKKVDPFTLVYFLQTQNPPLTK